MVANLDESRKDPQHNIGFICKVSTHPMVGGGHHTMLIHFMYNHSRYRYHKSAIIFQIDFLLVGISDCLLQDLLHLNTGTL